MGLKSVGFLLLECPGDTYHMEILETTFIGRSGFRVQTQKLPPRSSLDLGTGPMVQPRRARPLRVWSSLHGRGVPGDVWCFYSWKWLETPSTCITRKRYMRGCESRPRIGRFRPRVDGSRIGWIQGRRPDLLVGLGGGVSKDGEMTARKVWPPDGVSRIGWIQLLRRTYASEVGRERSAAGRLRISIGSRVLNLRLPRGVSGRTRA